jgi:hyperosmotically inducible protein
MRVTPTPRSATLALLVASGAFSFSARAAQNGNPQLQAEVQKALDNKNLKAVTASVQGNDVVLGGTVNLYGYKELAQKRVQHVHGVKGIDNEIQVAGPTVEDAELRDKLAKQLSTYTIGYGTTTFDNLTIGVHNGVVVLGGSVYWEPDKDSAEGIAANTPGVKDVINNIQVQPVSPMDDQLRRALARAIYGTPQLQMYAVDPSKPIRIVVENGKVTLAGVVNTQADKDLAGIRANTVPGVFKVTNDLQVANGSGR